MGIETQTLRDLLTTQARRFEKKTFLEFGDQQYSYGAVDDRTDRVATGLQRLGMRSGDKIALLLSNRPEFIFVFLGSPKLGIIPVPLNPFLSSEEIQFAVQHAEVSAVVTEAQFMKQALELREKVSRVRHWIVVDDVAIDLSFQRLDKLTEGPVLGFWPDLDPENPAAILSTRGTTGTPKAVVLTHRNLVSNCRQMIQPFRINDTDRFLCALPLHSVTAQVLLLITPLLAGATCILREGFDSQTILQEFSGSRPTILAGVPQLYDVLAGLPNAGHFDLSAFRLAICNTGPVGALTLRQFEERYDALLVEGYGLVEATCISCANPYTGVRKPGSLGLPLPGQEVRIVNELNQTVASGKIGEIVVRGPNVMKGYYNDPAASARALQDGWLHTGDLGYIDAEGYYYLTGRMENDK